MIYETLLGIKHSKKPLNLQSLINIMYYDAKRVQLNTDTFDYVEVDGCKFKVSDQIDSVQRVKGNSWFSGIQSGDIVVDIGANIGAITIPLAKVAKKVYAVEPLFHDLLADNIALNNLGNVEILKYAMSPNETEDIIFSSRRKKVNCISWNEIRYNLPIIDFLKVDCEGGEWDIKPDTLKGIRELRLEFHIRRKHFNDDTYALFGVWYDWLVNNDYKFELTEGDSPPPFHTIKECYLLKASKK